MPNQIQRKESSEKTTTLNVLLLVQKVCFSFYLSHGLLLINTALNEHL